MTSAVSPKPVAAMLESVQTGCADGSGFGVTENAEYAALLAQRIPFEIVLGLDRGLPGRDLAEPAIELGVIRGVLHLVPSPLFGGLAHLATGFSISFLSCSRAGLL